MPVFSLFTPLGLFELSREPSEAERLFDAGRASLGPSYRVERGTRSFAWLYAWSMTLAVGSQLVRRAGEQWDPARTWEYLDVQEAERGSIPRAEWTIGERRAWLVRMRKLIQNVSRAGIENALREVLGDRFLAYLPTAKEDIVNWPVALGDSPMLLTRADTPRAVGKLTNGNATTGVPQTLNYERAAEGVPLELRARDIVVIEPESNSRAERVEITDASDGDGFGYTLTCTPVFAHPAGSIVTRQPYPMWTGSKRHSLVVLTEEAAEDPEARRLVHWTLERMARAVSTWDVAGANTDGTTAGPFKVGVGKLGITPIGAVEL